MRSSNSRMRRTDSNCARLIGSVPGRLPACARHWLLTGSASNADKRGKSPFPYDSYRLPKHKRRRDNHRRINREIIALLLPANRPAYYRRANSRRQPLAHDQIRVAASVKTNWRLRFRPNGKCGAYGLVHRCIRENASPRPASPRFCAASTRPWA